MATSVARFEFYIQLHDRFTSSSGNVYQDDGHDGQIRRLVVTVLWGRRVRILTSDVTMGLILNRLV